METRKQLKDVFKGVSSVLFQKTSIFPDLSGISEFNPASTYAIGQQVSYNGKYYKNSTAITEAAAWDSTKWTEIKQGDVSNIQLAPDFDLPVHVDDLSLNEGDPTINHYKVLGSDSDWVATATKGNFDIKFVVPTKHTDVLKLSYGDDAVVDAKATMGQDSFTGVGLTLEKHEVKGAIILLNENKDQMLIISMAALWASLKYDKVTTEPFAVQFNGTLEATEGPDILFLKKVA